MITDRVIPSPFLKIIFRSLKLICAIGSGFDQHNQSGRFLEPITLHSFTLQVIYKFEQDNFLMYHTGDEHFSC